MYSLIPSSIVLLAASSALASPVQSSEAALAKRSCPADFVNVVFNSGYSASMFSQMSGASEWITFGLGTDANRIPMMAFQTDVANAVTMVNGPNPPAWMLTFNEPDYSYMGFTPTMTPQQASDAIQPLLASPGSGTKFVAPVPADPTSTWLPEFFTACNCQGFFSAYNIHVYLADLGAVQSDITTFHNSFADKPMWVTEIAPGNDNCVLTSAEVSTYMTGLYQWGASVGWIGKIFWNTGNYVANDSNVCNSNLLDANSNATPILATFNALTC